LSDVVLEPAGALAPAATTRRRRPRRARVRVRVMGVLRWSHRWVSIVAGLLLLVLTTSGAFLLFEPEARKVAHPAQYHATPTKNPISLDAAVAAAQRAYPHAGAPSYLARNRGVDQVSLGESPSTLVSVDPGTGKVLGATRPERGFWGLLVNVHECALSCEGYPLYIKAFNKPMPDLGIQGVDKLTVGSFVLGAFGFILMLLVLSGVVLWWPGRRKLRRGFTVRFRKGRYGRDYDLHKVIGAVAIPFLAMWALTGMDFELPVVGKAYYAVVGGAPGPDPEMTSAKAAKGTPDIGAAAAGAAALRLAPGAHLKGVNLPTADDATSTYLVWVAHGIDPMRNADYPGVVGIGVDRHTGHAEFLYGKLGRPLRQTLWEDWTTGAHYGTFIGWLPRVIWLLFGIAPLALAVTGMSTWLYKRGKRRERKRRRKAAAAVLAAEAEADDAPLPSAGGAA
jgi:uncharacterized iron-regulated membrane protein